MRAESAGDSWPPSWAAEAFPCPAPDPSPLPAQHQEVLIGIKSSILPAFLHSHFKNEHVLLVKSGKKLLSLYLRQEYIFVRLFILRLKGEQQVHREPGRGRMWPQSCSRPCPAACSSLSLTAAQPRLSLHPWLLNAQVFHDSKVLIICFLTLTVRFLLFFMILLIQKVFVKQY